MICTNCFANENLKDYIKKVGKKADKEYICLECNVRVQDIIDDTYILSKSDLAKKLQDIILKLYEHDNNLEMLHYAEKNICENGEDPNKYAKLKCLQSICFELFEDEEIIPELLSENISYSHIQDGGDDLFSDIHSEVWKEKCWLDNEKFGLSQWQTFSENVKHKARYFNHKDFSVTNFLDKLQDLFSHLEYSTNLTIYRARKINSLEEEITITSNPSCELGKVPIKFAQNNRFSPIGISYGYFALDKTTAIKEIRATNDDKVAIGKFKITDELRLVDFRFKSMESKVNIFNTDLDISLYCQQQFIKEFLQDISKPIKDSKQHLEYIPTQIMAEYIWHLEIDGFLFDSSQNKDGVNLVVFEAKYNFEDYEIKNKQNIMIKYIKSLLTKYIIKYIKLFAFSLVLGIYGFRI
jgi:hypothetical protein